MEVFLGTLGLCFIMYATGSLWMLPFTAPALTAAVLVTYSVLFNSWEHWRVSWIILVWIGIGSVALPFWLSRWKTLSRGIGRIFAVIMGLISIVLMLAVIVWVLPVYFGALIGLLF